MRAPPRMHARHNHHLLADEPVKHRVREPANEGSPRLSILNNGIAASKYPSS